MLKHLQQKISGGGGITPLKSMRGDGFSGNWVTKKTAGFTLVELSIVLVILGLLVGTVMSGQVLVRAAEMNSVAVDFEEIRSATDSFRTKYTSLPGDMPNATNFWGIQAGATGNDSTCYNSPSTDAKTCNGNGDGLIYTGYVATPDVERGRYWQHLANAGLIEGKYTGYQGSTTATEFRVGGLNAKASRLGATHYNVGYGNTATSAWWATNMYPISGHILELVKDFPAQPEPMRDILTADEAWNIDTKLDDGKPATGIMRGSKMGYARAPICTTSTATTADYALSLSGKICYVYMLLKADVGRVN